MTSEGRPNIAREERIEEEVEVCEARRRPQRDEALCRGRRTQVKSDERTSTHVVAAGDAEPAATPRSAKVCQHGPPAKVTRGEVHRTGRRRGPRVLRRRALHGRVRVESILGKQQGKRLGDVLFC